MSQQSSRIINKALPYFWPKDRPNVKVRIVISVILLILAKLVSISIPFFYKLAVDSLDQSKMDFIELFSLGAVGFTICYGSMRLMSVFFQELRDVVFAYVGQGAIRLLALETIRHIHNLSMRYHISRKTGALSRVIERGVKGIDFLLRHLLFNVVPLFIELLLVSIILIYVFGFLHFVIIVGTIIFYIILTSLITEWRVRIRREMNERDQDANQKAIDSMLNFETVKYFNAEEVEAKRYDQSMAEFEKASIMTLKSLALLNILQSLTINLGMVSVMILVARQVQLGELSIGDFVMINTYIIQIMMPLHFLGFVYREVRQAMIDMSEMFILLEQPKEIKDKKEAKDIDFKKGKIEFKNIDFGYDRERQILDGVSFSVLPGKKIAIVGTTGSGKSTIGRLLFRFYDVWKGKILIDGQDIRDVKQRSVQKLIGVIPQDTVLFNDSIYYNISYGNPKAVHEDIIKAAKIAKIHDFIISLPEGYNTIVGERGLKLSGGEKQRVGIARTILKDPPILLLDEATSALDTKTERSIQSSLDGVLKGRSVIMIAHRLSTIIDADEIIVLESGKIVEKGSHEKLLKLKGRYKKMWEGQKRSGKEE